MQIQSDTLDAIEKMTNSTLTDFWPSLANCARDNNEGKSLADNMRFLEEVLEKYRYQLIIAFTFSILKQLRIAIYYVQVSKYIIRP